MTITTAGTPVQGYVAGPEEGERIWIVGDTVRLLADGERTGGALTAAESVSVPGAGPPLHVHENEDEVLYVVEGMFQFFIDDEMTILRAGAFVFIPRGTPHRFLCIGEGPGRLFGLFTPGGVDAFFREAGRPATHDGPAPAPDPGEIERTLAAGERHGLRVMAPPM